MFLYLMKNYIFSEDVISFVNKFKKSGKSVKNLDQWFPSEFEIMPPEYSNILLSKDLIVEYIDFLRGLLI